MSYENRNEYLPTKYWVKNNQLHRAFYEYETECYDSPRDWGNIGIIVNFSDYHITGSDDKVANDIEEWLIKATGINEDWYESHRNSYGVDGLLKKFIREQCAAFQYISIYDHSGIAVSCGKAYGWDYSNVGFIYVPLSSADYKQVLEETNTAYAKAWAEKTIVSEIKILDDYCQGSVYSLVEEVYNNELHEWENVDCIGNVYLTSDNWDKEKELAIAEIKANYSHSATLIDEKTALNAIDCNMLDTLLGQMLFDFVA